MCQNSILAKTQFGTQSQPKPVVFQLRSQTWFQDLMKLWFLISHCRKNSAQSLSRVWVFVTQWTAVRQVSLSIANSQSLLKLISIELVMPSSISSSVITFSSHLQSYPASGSFQISQLFASGGQSIGVSASASVLPMSIQDWFPLGWTGWISLQSKGLSRVFSNIKVQKHQFFSAQLSL